MDFHDGSRSSPNRTLLVETIRRQLQSGNTLRIPTTLFMVRRPRQGIGQSAGTYVKCELGDQSGWIEAVWWDAGKVASSELETLLSTPIWSVEGAASLNRYGGRETPQLRIESVRPATNVDPTKVPGLVRRSDSSEAELGQWLSTTIDELKNRHLRGLLGNTLGEGGEWRDPYLAAPAALYYHHSYVGGLAEHAREMATAWQACLSVFPGVDRDLTLAGILLHDIGKLETLEPGPIPQLTRAGRYMDHISAGIARLSHTLDLRDDFPASIREHLIHIVASHHGTKEHGSPVVPATREAIVVHHLDRLSSLLSHFEEWTRQSTMDPFGWSIEQSPWLKTSLAVRPTPPGDIDLSEPID